MALRDVVDNCGDGSRSANPVLRLIDSFTGEKAAFHEKWMAQRSRPQGPEQVMMRPPMMHNAGELDDFARFAEQDMAKEFESLNMEHRRPPPMAYGHGRGPMIPESMKGHPRDLQGYMDRMGAPRHMQPIEGDPDAWDSAFEAAAMGEKEQFEAFERAYGIRSHNGPPRHMQDPRAQLSLPMGPGQWASEFEEDAKFAELERIYRGSVAPLPAEAQQALAREASVPAREKWASEFEEMERPGGVWQREFEDFSSSAPGGAQAMPESESQKWADEFDRKFGASWASQFERETGGVEAEAPLGEGIYDDPDDMAMRDAESFDFSSPPTNQEYKFAEGENSFEGDTEAFERGRALFKAGRLTEAIEAFEAAVKQDATHSLAWQMLGATQAENDRDDLAALALLKAVQTDPDNRDALITLSVSYVNDFHKLRALECLQQWLSTSSEYQAIDTNVPLGSNFERNHEMITNLFIQAARMRPADPDPDVQIALGLLYNLTFDYAKAIDCFKAAAMKRPDDYLVWNKLGATQANAKLSEEAIDSFIRALEIKPSYTRACSNLGISFMSLSEYGEAAKAFLSALALNPNALHQWENLHNVFSLMKRPDLLKKCATRDISLFQDEFHF